MRSTLSPAFTGSKIRQMFDLISECAEQMVQSVQSECDSGTEDRSVDHEMKELFGKYANDVISSTAFGYKIDTFVDPKNEFYLSGQTFSEFASVKGMFRVLMLLMLPRLSTWLNISLIDTRVIKFFRNMVLDNIESREKHGIFRPDMINILMNVKTGNSHLNTTTTASEESHGDGFASVEESSIGKRMVKREWSDDEIVAQCFGFFLASFDTSSTVLSFVAYELSVNQDIQQKLYDEIVGVQTKLVNGTKLTYEVIQSMKYMDQFISEILRYWPPAPGLDRVCVKDYGYDDGEYRFTIEKGTTLLIPVHGLHFDEKNWNEPRKFNPERFSDANKDKIVPGSYIPFGTGPRSCIVMKFEF